MNKKIAIFLICLLSGIASKGYSLNIADVNIPDSFSAGGHRLILNGAGIREQFFMDLYVGALYLPV